MALISHLRPYRPNVCIKIKGGLRQYLTDVKPPNDVALEIESLIGSTELEELMHVLTPEEWNSLSA